MSTSRSVGTDAERFAKTAAAAVGAVFLLVGVLGFTASRPTTTP